MPGYKTLPVAVLFSIKLTGRELSIQNRTIQGTERMSWLQHSTCEPTPTKAISSNQHAISGMSKLRVQQQGSLYKNNRFLPLAMMVKMTDSNTYYLDIYFSLPAHFIFASKHIFAYIHNLSLPTAYLSLHTAGAH